MTFSRRDLLVVAPSVLALSAAKPGEPPAARAHGAAVDAVLQVLAEQAQAWSKGQIEAFCSAYHDDAVFVSPSGLTRTRAAVLERYKKKYPSAEKMGTLSFAVLHAIADDGVASVALRWRLTFVGGVAPAEGFSVVGLQHDQHGWRIVHDASM